MSGDSSAAGSDAAECRHCPQCLAEFAAPELATCSDCGAALVPGPSPRYAQPPSSDPDVGEDAGGEFVRLATIRGTDAATTLHDLLTEEGVETLAAWRGPRGSEPPAADALCDLCVRPRDILRARELLAQWADTDAIVSDESMSASRDDVELVVGPEQREPPAQPVSPMLEATVPADRAAPLPGLRHCASCGAEFDGSRTVCSDCGVILLEGPSPRYDTPREDAEGSLDDEPLSPRDFVPLVQLRDGEDGNELWRLLDEAGIATFNAGPHQTQMRAPGHQPFGPSLSGMPVTVAVFPQDLTRATQLLAEWRARDGQSSAELAIADLGRDVADGSSVTAQVVDTVRPAKDGPTADWVTIALLAAFAGVIVLLGALLLRQG